MKKLILSLVAAMVCATAMYAQTSLVATLNHENAISVFHGQNALADAMAAAEHGDLITLSGGTFKATDITKAVILRGTGIAEDEVTGQYLTRITNGFNLAIPTDAGHVFSMDGIYCSEKITLTGRADDAKFSKCRFLSIDGNFSTSSLRAYGWTFTNCDITSSISIPQSSSATFINCRVVNPKTFSSNNGAYPDGTGAGSMEFNNCIVVASNSLGFSGTGINGIYNSKFTNCFIFQTYSKSSKSLLYSNMAYNCVGYDVSGTAPVFANINQATNTELTADEYNALFKEGTFYELTDEAKTKYIGNDGTEVGLYGGVLPYTTRIMNPQITKCNVAKKTTTDGKLSVDLEVKAAE